MSYEPATIRQLLLAAFSSRIVGYNVAPLDVCSNLFVTAMPTTGCAARRRPPSRSTWRKTLLPRRRCGWRRQGGHHVRSIGPGGKGLRGTAGDDPLRSCRFVGRRAAGGFEPAGLFGRGQKIVVVRGARPGANSMGAPGRLCGS